MCYRYCIRLTFLLFVCLSNIHFLFPVHLDQDSVFRRDLHLRSLMRPGNVAIMEYDEETNEVIFMDRRLINPAFMPVIFTGKVLQDDRLTLSLNPEEALYNRDIFIPSYLKKEEPDLFKNEKIRQEINRKAYLYITYHRPAFIKYNVADFPDDLPEPTPIQPHWVRDLREIFKIEGSQPDISHIGAPDRYEIKRKYWILTGTNLIQFSQTHLSDNWHKGGTGNLNLVSNHTLNLNYKKEKITFNNQLQWNLSLFTNPNDTLRAVKIGNDVLRNYTDFGLQAFNQKWYYSTNLNVETQLFNNYGENTTTKLSAFISPVVIEMGILGMKYENTKTYPDDKYKKFNINVDVSPLSVQYKYVLNDEVDPTRYKIEEGKRHLLDLGSKVNSTLNYNVNRAVTVKSRFKYFTDYDKMEIELESELNIAMNRFFSTRLYLYLRFDDGDVSLKDDKLGYLQINEVLSFGFNYKW